MGLRSSSTLVSFSGAAEETITLNTTDTSVLFDNLAKYTLYEVQVLAFTKIGVKLE